VAEALGVSERIIQIHYKELHPNETNFAGQNSKNGRIPLQLTEQDVTEIKKRMRLTTKAASSITDLEAAEMLLRSAEHFKVRFEQERELRIKTENKLAIAEPKAETLDKITATKSDISVRELAAVLAIPHLGQNNFFDLLRQDGYIDGYKRPYRQYIEAGLMYEKEYYIPQLDATKRQLRITQKGVAYFAKRYGRVTA
jgi:phage antirepressor YoqD-like protein